MIELLEFHKSHTGIGTVTSVHPSASFGEVLSNNDGLVSSFKEKPSVENSWINGGYFVFEQDFFEYIDKSKNEMLEQRPLERLVEKRSCIPINLMDIGSAWIRQEILIPLQRM